MNQSKNSTSNTDPARSHRSQNLKFKIGWLILFGLALAWRVQNLDAFGLSNDEGAHLMWARLAVEGYPLYSQTQAVQAPLFLESVGLAFRLAGQTIQAGRWAMLTGFGLLAVSLSWLAHRGGGWCSALTAMIMLGLSPLIFAFSRLVMAEVPATGLAVTALAFMFLFLDRGNRRWLLLSGVALGLSFMIKALNPFVAVPIGLLLMLRSSKKSQFFQKNGFLKKWPWPGLCLDGCLWTIGLLTPLVAVWLIYEPAALYDQLGAFRGDLRAALPGSWSETWAHFAVFLKSHWGFWLLAGGGIISAVLPVRVAKAAGPDGFEARSSISSETRNAQHAIRDESLHSVIGQNLSGTIYPFIWVIWLIAGLAMLAWHTPLFPHHFIVLLPPLILLGAGFIADNVGAVNVRTFNVLSLVIVVAVFNVPAMVKANQETAAIVTGGRETEAIALLKAVSLPNDFVMGDSQLLIFMADRRTPPPLGDVALVAIKAGRQTSARMIDLNRTYQAPAVVQWSLRLPWLPEYLAWVETHYLARRVWDDDHIIYFAPRFPSDQPMPNERLVRLGDRLTLRGYQIEEAPVSAGGDLNLKVYWQADVPLSDDYTVFTQLLDSNETLVAGWDHQPLDGYFPTSHWPAGEIVTDVVQLPLPPDLPAGDYTLITGMYLLDTLGRLSTSTGSDHVTLTTITLLD